MKELTVIRDTREKEPWDFSNSSFVNETIIQTMTTGDYTLKGFEDLLCIERKKDIKEFAVNIVQERFKAELERMRDFKYRFLIFEFHLKDILDFPKGLPPEVAKKTYIKPQFLMKWIADIQVDYDVHVIFGQNAHDAKYVALNIMRKVYELEHKD